MLNFLSNTVETHDLKLKPSYKVQHQQAYGRYTQTQIYIRLSNHIKLESDKLNDIQTFWKSINTALYSTLSTNKGLGIYKELTSIYNIKDTITPPKGHTQYYMGQTAYEHFTIIIRDYITNKKVIDNEKIHNVFKILTRQQINEDVFIILMKIVQTGSLHLGGEARGLTNYVAILKIIKGGKLVEYYTKVK